MPILESDIVLLASQVMDDVPEGGGAATGTVIADGASNAIFDDVGERDRVFGNVSLRKVFPAIRTPDTDTYYGGNAIVDSIPADAHVCCTLFTTNDFFDRRDAARNRMESYLARGPKFAGLLYEDHYAGQQLVQIIAREGVAPPRIGQTLLLTGNAGLTTEYRQYVRVTEVSIAVRTFSYASGGGWTDYTRQVMSCGISDRLTYDFHGSPASPGDAPASNSAVLNETVVADAARYYGASALAVAGETGDITCQVRSIYTQLVPSAQTDIPIADATPTSSVAALAAAANADITLSSGAAWGPNSSLYLGGSVKPGTLRIVAGATTITDRGGALVLANGDQIGTVDYTNGVATIAAGGPTYGGTKSVAYRPASAPLTPSSTLSIPVTAESQSLTLVITLDPLPSPGTLRIAYMALGVWYELVDDGSGALRGMDSGYGAGSLSPTTGTATITFGALPDVGSAILVSWASNAGVKGIEGAQTTTAYFEIDVGSPILEPGVVVTWNDGTARTATEANGTFTGDATGVVDRAAGKVRISPNALPPQGTAFHVSYKGGAPLSDIYMSGGSDGTTWSATFPAPIVRGTFRAQLPITRKVTSEQTFNLVDQAALHNIADAPNGGGDTGTIYIQFEDGSQAPVGAINYVTGLVQFARAIASPVKVFRDAVVAPRGGIDGAQIWVVLGYTTREQAGSIVGPAAITASYTTGASTPATKDVTPSTLLFRVPGDGSALAPGNLVASLGSWTLRDVASSSSLISDFDASTGHGTERGTLQRDTRLAILTAWPASGPGVTVSSALARLAAPKVSSVAFRTPVAPLRPSSFSIVAQAPDGTTLSATSDADGNIVGARVSGRINYETGVGMVQFLSSAGARTVTYPTYTGNPGTEYNGYSGSSVVPSGSANATTSVCLVLADTIRFSAVGYSYLPLDAALIGLDPVRLPSDGRVPIFRPGEEAVVHHTARTAPVTVSNGSNVNCGRTRLARVRVIGSDGVTIQSGYTVDLDAGIVTFTDVTGYHQPVIVEHRIEDALLVQGVQISGQLSFARQLSHDFPLGSLVSSAMFFGDNGNLHARVPVLFDQQTWGNVWSDSVIGSGAPASYNDVLYPIRVTNVGAITERWAIVFTNSTSFNVIGEHVGQIASGNTASDCAPINPTNGQPYFSVAALGWGSGWAAGNVLRFNTVGALGVIWAVRTVQQGPAMADEDSFSILIRGDIDRP
ncbi:hypothetical protein [Niveibacterium sp. SC-1]|uniref:hypothetical protein n=1 Tax=Niveibacterium sp. SC-1 TaxID=3135646 RepID=UPI00311FB798